VTVNPRAQLSGARNAAASASTPTEELKEEVAQASGIAAKDDLKWTPEVVASAADKNTSTGTYSHLVSQPVAAPSLDALSMGETNPSLEPVKVGFPATGQTVPREETTNQLSTSEAVAIAESERLLAESSSGSKIQGPPAGEGAAPGSEPPMSSPEAQSGVLLSGNDLMAEGSGVRAEGGTPRNRTLMMLALGFLGLLAGGAMTYLLTRPPARPVAGLIVDAGTAPTDGHGAEIAGTPKVAPGELRLASEPAADVFIDGQPRGRTPVVLPLPPGPHKLLLVAEEYQLLRKEVTAGTALSLKLERAKLPDDVAGEQVVKIKCKSKGELRILVEGNDTGLSCPTENLLLAPGKFRFGFLRPATEELQEKQQKVKKGKSPTKMKVKF
jgi:hypothetical protein